MRTQTREQGIEQRIRLSIEPLRLQDPFGDSLKRDRCCRGFAICPLLQLTALGEFTPVLKSFGQLCSRSQFNLTASTRNSSANHIILWTSVQAAPTEVLNIDYSIFIWIVQAVQAFIRWAWLIIIWCYSALSVGPHRHHPPCTTWWPQTTPFATTAQKQNGFWKLQSKVYRATASRSTD